MYHHSTNAEIARLAHAESLRRSSHAHHVRDAEDVSELYTLQERIVARLATRLAPELSVTLPWPIVTARRAGGASA